MEKHTNTQNEAVKRAIKIAGTQAKLAGLTGLTQGAISNMLLMRKRPSKDSSEKMSIAVNHEINWHEFMDGYRPINKKTKTKQSDEWLMKAINRPSP